MNISKFKSRVPIINEKGFVVKGKIEKISSLA